MIHWHEVLIAEPVEHASRVFLWHGNHGVLSGPYYWDKYVRQFVKPGGDGADGAVILRISDVDIESRLYWSYWNGPDDTLDSAAAKDLINLVYDPRKKRGNPNWLTRAFDWMDGR